MLSISSRYTRNKLHVLSNTLTAIDLLHLASILHTFTIQTSDMPELPVQP